MIRHAFLLVIYLYATKITLVNSAKQQVPLSGSYLPVAMQIIAHLTDQMAYEASDEPTKTTNIPIKQTTSKPYVWRNHGSHQASGSGGWRMKYGLRPVQRLDLTTPFHRPGLFAPVAPPKPSDRLTKHDFVLLPFDHNTQYTVIAPEQTRTEEPLLSIHHEEIKPLVEPAKEDKEHLLPPHFVADVDKISRKDDINEDNLQYLSQNVREMIKMANDDDERLIDVWEGVRANKNDVQPKGKLSGTNLRLLLLYDLLSREAKRLRLSDYGGFSPDVMQALVESSSGGARAQLSMALSRMVDRRDCEHDYANNRAREMVTELANDQSKMSAEIRYLQPLVYTF